MANYTGTSIVDYLKSIGQPSNFSSRMKLATQKGITDYTGTAAQNTQLLNLLKGAAPAPTITPKVPTKKVLTPEEETKKLEIETQITDIQTQIEELIPQYKRERELETAAITAGEKGLPYPKGYVEGLTDEEREAIRTGVGITPELVTKAFAPTPSNFQTLFTQAYDVSGLADVKVKMTEMADKISAAEEVYNESLSSINENPWLSEASRVGQVKRLKETQGRDIDRLKDDLDRFTKIYDKGVEEAEKVAERTLTGYESARKLSKEYLTYLTGIAEAEIKTREEEEAWRYYPEYAEARPGEEVEYLSPAEAKSLGVAYGTTKSQARAMGIIIPEKPLTEAQQLAVAKTDMKTQLMGVRGTDGYISPESYKIAKEAWHQAGLSKRKFDEYFEMFVNPAHPQDYKLEGV